MMVVLLEKPYLQTPEKTNSLPSVDNIIIRNDTNEDVSIGGLFYTGDMLTCSGSDFDLDGDEVTFEYTWFAGETEASMTQRGSGDSYEVDEDDNFIYCEIIPNDGTVSGDPYTSSTVEKSDSSPTFVQPAELTLSGSGQSAVLTCSGNASDIDGDDITYTFEFHSSLYGDVFYSIVQTTSISHTVSLNDAGYMILKILLIYFMNMVIILLYCHCECWCIICFF